MILTRRSKLEWEVSEKSFSCNVSHGSKDDNRSGEARMTETDSLISRELGHGLGPHQVLPVILKHVLIEIMFYTL